MDDKEYSAPSDHYFGYIAKQKMQGNQEDTRESEVMQTLEIDQLLPREDSLRQIEKATPSEDEGEDVFEMAKGRGVSVKELNELRISEIDYASQWEKIYYTKLNESGQRHTKEEYQKLDSMTF